MSTTKTAAQTTVEMTICQQCGRTTPAGAPSISSPDMTGWLCSQRCSDSAEIEAGDNTQQLVSDLFVQEQ